MKRRDLERHLRENDCFEAREGSAHTLFVNSANGSSAAVPRHNEINTITVREICKQLGIPIPKGR
jgi:predicted RNA binding protein YcfA (HicA-like mRNA interferase family)